MFYKLCASIPSKPPRLSTQIRRSLKIRTRRKEKEKLPSGITADYSAEFFAQLDIDRGAQSDRGNEEVLASANATIDTNSSYSSLVSDSSATKLSPGPRMERVSLSTQEFGGPVLMYFFVFSGTASKLSSRASEATEERNLENSQSERNNGVRGKHD